MIVARRTKNKHYDLIKDVKVGETYIAQDTKVNVKKVFAAIYMLRADTIDPYIFKSEKSGRQRIFRRLA